MVYFGRLKFENCFIFANDETEKIEYTSTFAIVYLFVRYDRCAVSYTHLDIATPELWMLGDGHCFRDQVVNLCEMRGTQHKNLPFDFESNSLETLMKIVDREGGFTLIPELATLYMTEEKKKQVRSFTVSKPLREVSVIYSRHFTKQKLIDLLCEDIRQVVPPGMLKKERGKIVEWKKIR